MLRSRKISSQKLGILFILCVLSISWSMPIYASRPASPATPTATIINSNITSDTTWTLANSPYHLLTNVDVEAGVTLSIEPGVEIWIDAKRYIHVREGASIIAKGTPTQRITISRYIDPETGTGSRDFFNYDDIA